MESHLHSSEFMTEARTHVATIAQKTLATAAINYKVDQCSKFSECKTLHLTD